MFKLNIFRVSCYFPDFLIKTNIIQGYLVEGIATLSLVYLPGLIVLLLELKEALRGKGNIFRSIQ